MKYVFEVNKAPTLFQGHTHVVMESVWILPISYNKYKQLYNFVDFLLL
jgi:hypothetical protein